MNTDLLITDCHLATMVVGGAAYGAISDGAILIADGRIAWVGARADLPAHSAKETHRLDGRWVTPGLIDCHTHLVFGGDRSGEFEQRLQGVSYEAIARAGGGTPKVKAVDLTEYDPSLEIGDLGSLTAGRWFCELLAGFDGR